MIDERQLKRLPVEDQEKFHAMYSQFVGTAQDFGARRQPLTERQKHVYSFHMEGMNAPEIAMHLGATASAIRCCLDEINLKGWPTSLK